MDARVHIFIATALGTGRIASPTLGRLYQRKAPGTHFTGGWVDLRTSLDTKEQRKISTPPRSSGFYDAINISGHRRRFLQWSWKVRQILLRGSNFGLRFFTCRKSTTRDPRLYFPSEGSHTQDFYSLKKVPWPRPGLNPRTSDPVASMITTGPPGWQVYLWMRFDCSFVGQVCFVCLMLGLYCWFSGPGGSIGKALGYGLDGPGVGGMEIFLHSFVSRLALGSTQPPIKWVPGNFPGGKGGRAWD